MANNPDGLHLTLAECRALWTAVVTRIDRLSGASAVEEDEDRQVLLDEEQQDLDGVRKSLMLYARATYGLEIDAET